MDLKYDILKHPNVLQTTDGNETAYVHGSIRNAVATIGVELKNTNDEFEKVEASDNECEYVVLSNEEIINYLYEEEDVYENKNE